MRGGKGAKWAGGGARIGMVPVLLLLGLLIVAVLAASLWFVRDAAEQTRADDRGQVAEAVATLLAQQVAGDVAGVRSRMAAAAERPELFDALSAGSTDAMEEAVTGLRSAFPEALRVALVPVGFDETALDSEPPVGYALLDMLRQAEDREQPVGPEGHLPGRDNAHVNFVEPLVSDGDDVVGHLVVSYPSSWPAGDLVLPEGVNGRLELLQEDHELFGVGIAGAPILSRATTVPDTSWQVRFEPETAGTGYKPLADPWFLTIVGVTGALILLLVAVAGRLLTAAQRRDLQAWRGLVQDLAAGRAPGIRTAGFPETQRVIDDVRPVDGPPVSARAPKGDVPQAVGVEPSSMAPPPDSGITVEEIDDMTAAPDDSGDDGAAAPARQKENGVKVDPSLFRAYDIRGVVETALTPDVVREIGRSIGTEAAARGCAEVVVGRDGRLSSEELAEALIEGLRSTGRQVIDIGEVPTPVMYFATHHLQTGTGVEITGSHNPPEYNGLKIMIGGETLSGEAITGLYQRIADGDLMTGDGQVRRQDVVADYLDAIASDITLHRPLRVVLDAGNGVAGAVAPQVLRAIGCEVEPLYCEVDGNFPNHHPDPSDPENLEALIRLVRLQQADVGLALDGDGDRLGVVDGDGKIIWADRQMMLYAGDVLSRHPGADIVFDVKCSSQLAQVVSEHAGVPVMWRTGHSLIKAKLKASGAPLAGEMSGHIFFNDRWPGFDDGIYTAARLLEILSMDDRSSSEVFAALPEAVSTPELKVQLEEGEPPQVIERLVAAADFPDARVTTIDGLRVDFPDGWGLVRSSNTTPCLVLRFEGDDEQSLERIRAIFRELLEQARPGLDLPF